MVILLLLLALAGGCNTGLAGAGAQQTASVEIYLPHSPQSDQSIAANGVVALADHGFLVLSSILDTVGPSTRAWVVKTDARGKAQWQHEIGENLRDDYFFRGIPTRDNGALLIGSAKGQFSGSQSRERASGWIARLDADGRIRWQHFLELASVTRLMDIKATLDGGAIVVGRLRQNGQDAALAAKLDVLGNVVWTRRYERGPAGWADFVVVRRPGEFIVSNSTNGPWLAALGNDGRLLWDRRSREWGNVSRLSALAEVPDGTLIVAAVEGQVGKESVSLLRLSSNGGLMWKRRLAESRFCAVSGIWSDDATTLRAVGQTCPGVEKRVWVGTFSVSSGALLNSWELMPQANAQLAYAAPTPADGFVAVGWFLPPDNGAWLATGSF